MNKLFFKALPCLLLLLGITLPTAAQKKRWEHNIYESVGRVNKFDPYDEQTIALRIGYGINYYLTDKWSVMPGAGLRMKAAGETNDYSGYCGSTFLEIPMLAQYHTGGDKRKGFVAECGPVLSFLVHERRWTGDGWAPSHPFDGNKRYKNFDIGIRPGIYYETKQWRFGVQSHIGLLDIKRKHLRETYHNRKLQNRYHAFDVTATINFYL